MEDSNFWLWLVSPLGICAASTLIIVAFIAAAWWWTKPKQQEGDRQPTETDKTKGKDEKAPPTPEDKKDGKEADEAKKDKDEEKKQKEWKELVDRVTMHIVWILTFVITASLLWYYKPWQEYPLVLTWVLIIILGLVSIVFWRYDAEQKKLTWWPALAITLVGVSLIGGAIYKGAEPVSKAYYESKKATDEAQGPVVFELQAPVERMSRTFTDLYQHRAKQALAKADSWDLIINEGGEVYFLDPQTGQNGVITSVPGEDIDLTWEQISRLQFQSKVGKSVPIQLKIY